MSLSAQSRASGGDGTLATKPPTRTGRAEWNPARFQYPLAILAGMAGGALILLAAQIAPAYAPVTVVCLGGLTALLILGQVRRPMLALLAFLIPLRLDVSFDAYPAGHEGGPSAFTITAADIVLAFLILQWIAEIALGSRAHLGHVSGPHAEADAGMRARERIRLFPQVTVPALLFILLGAVSGLFAGDPLLTAFQTFELTKGLVLFVYLANRVQDPRRDLRWILAGLMGAVVFESGLGLYQALTGRPLGLAFLGETGWSVRQILGEHFSVRPVGTFWHTNQLAMYLGMTLPVIAAVLLVREAEAPAAVGRLLKLAAAAVTLLGLAVAAFTLSRGTWVGLILSALLLSAFGLSKKTLPRAYIFVAPGVLLATLLVLNLLTSNAIFLRLTESDLGSLESRVPLMRGALTVFHDYPILGSGLNNYQYTIKAYDVTGEFTETGFLPVVHNIFLLLVAETGLLGAGAFVWLLVTVGRIGLRYVRAGGPTLPVAVAMGILAGELHLIVHNTVHVGLAGDTALFMLFWFLTGLLVALAAWSSPPGTSTLVTEGHFGSLAGGGPPSRTR